MGTDRDRKSILCHSYSHVARLSDLINTTGGSVNTSDWPHGVLDEADGRPVNKPCLVLVDNTILSDAAVAASPYTFWCSFNGSGLGPGWLPLPLQTAAHLLETADRMPKNKEDLVSAPKSGMAITSGITFTS